MSEKLLWVGVFVPFLLIGNRTVILFYLPLGVPFILINLVIICNYSNVPDCFKLLNLVIVCNQNNVPFKLLNLVIVVTKTAFFFPLFQHSQLVSSLCCGLRAWSTNLILTSITVPLASWQKKASTAFTIGLMTAPGTLWDVSLGEPSTQVPMLGESLACIWCSLCQLCVPPSFFSW